METSSESTACLICFEIFQKPIFVGDGAAAKILKNCKTYLHSAITNETLKDVQLKNENEMPFCKSCFDSAWELTQFNQQLKALKNEISDSTVTFNMAVFHRRSQVSNSQTQNHSQSVNKSSIIELNVSCLPANTFLKKEEDQNVQQLKEKSNRNIIIDDQPEENIEITNVKFESCDLQFSDSPSEHYPPTTASVDATETLFSYQSQDCNQPDVGNTINLAIQREVETTGGNASVDSTNLNDESRLTMSDLIKSVKKPHVGLKRISGIKIVDLNVNAPSTNSSQKKSEPRPELHNKIKHKAIKFSNSNQNVQQLNETSSRDIIIDDHLDDNIEITHVKYESCDLELEDLPEDCQPTTASVDAAETLFNNQSQDFNQPSIDNTITLALQKEVKTKGENESVDSTNSKDDERQLTMSHLMKSVKKPQVELKRIKIMDLKVGAPSWSSCQLTSAPRHQTLKIKYKDNEFSKSDCVSSNSMGGKRFKCFYCEKTFNGAVRRNIHVRTHTGEKPYKCSFCTKGFADASNLARHEKCHTGEKPYECSFCKKRFITIGNQKCHERSHTGEKPYKCLYCEKTFRQIIHRKKHQSSHKTKQLSVAC